MPMPCGRRPGIRAARSSRLRPAGADDRAPLTMAIDALLLLLTFPLGWALARVSLCAVAALQQLIMARHYDGLLHLLLAASAPGVTLLLLAGLAPGSVLLPG